MSTLFSLSDDELSDLLPLTLPVPPDRRAEFLRSVADALAACPERGPGIVHRTAVDLQRQFIVALPLRHVAGFTSKYR